MLDFDKPYGLVYGHTECKYEQGGRFFRGDGSPVVRVVEKFSPDKPLPSLVGDKVIEAMIAEASQTPPGVFVEVGVYKGGTGWHLAKLAQEQKRSIYLYDTFEGMPYHTDFDAHKTGEFSDTSHEEVCKAIPYAKVIKGIFPASAVYMRKIAFAHIDCDQYQSIKDSVGYLVPKMVRGGVIWFDDYCLESAARAIDELFPGRLEEVAGKKLVRC